MVDFPAQLPPPIQYTWRNCSRSCGVDCSSVNRRLIFNFYGLATPVAHHVGSLPETAVGRFQGDRIPQPTARLPRRVCGTHASERELQEQFPARHCRRKRRRPSPTRLPEYRARHCRRLLLQRAALSRPGRQSMTGRPAARFRKEEMINVV